jgi:hypothetical protein
VAANLRSTVVVMGCWAALSNTAWARISPKSESTADIVALRICANKRYQLEMKEAEVALLFVPGVFQKLDVAISLVG